MEEEDFLAEKELVFRLMPDGIRMRKDSKESKLTVAHRGYVFENACVEAKLDRGFALSSVKLKAAFEGAISLRPAVEMAALYAGLRSSMPWL